MIPGRQRPVTARLLRSYLNLVKKPHTNGGRRRENGSWDKDVDTEVLQAPLPVGNEDDEMEEQKTRLDT